MKLLFDENLSPRLVNALAQEYPASTHVAQVGLRGAEDSRIWERARQDGLAIVSKDTDFRERSFVEDFPPKVIWLDVGNAGTSPIATAARSAPACGEFRDRWRDVITDPLHRDQRGLGLGETLSPNSLSPA